MATLKQSTAYTRTFMMIATSDHISGLTGATVSIKLSKAGGTGVSAGGTITEVDSTNNPGLYKIALTTTDTNTVGDLAFHCTATSADPTDFIDQVSATIVGDTLPANVLQWNSTNVASPATAGIPEVNVKNVNNISTSSVTAINANQGTTQPLNFTGIATSALVKSDMVDVAGSAVSTSTAQIGTNVVSVAAAASNIKKNTIVSNFTFVMTDATTNAPKTGLTVTATRSLDGGAFASCANAVSEIANGWYVITLAAADTNANNIALRFTGTGANDRDISLITQP